MKKVKFLFLVIVSAISIIACTEKWFLDIEIPETAPVVIIQDTIIINNIYQQTGLMFFDTPVDDGCKIRTWFIDENSDQVYTDGVDLIIGTDEICPDDNRVLQYERFPFGNCEVVLVIFGDTLLQDTLCPEFIHDTIYVDDMVICRHAPFVDSLNYPISDSARKAGWKFPEEISCNNLEAPNGISTFCIWEYQNFFSDTIFSPKFAEPTAIGPLEFDAGILEGDWGLELLFVRENGNLVSVKRGPVPEILGFVWYLQPYGKFIYSIDYSEVEYQDFIGFAIVITNWEDFWGKCNDPEWRNKIPNLKNFYVERFRIL